MMQVRKNLWVRSGVIYLCRLHLPLTVALLEHVETKPGGQHFLDLRRVPSRVIPEIA